MNLKDEKIFDFQFVIFSENYPKNHLDKYTHLGRYTRVFFLPGPAEHFSTLSGSLFCSKYTHKKTILLEKVVLLIFPGFHIFSIIASM